VPTGDTITALASPPGRSARALIRISGPGTRDLLVHACESLPPTRLAAARFRLTDSLSLPVLLLTARAPRSYTGEDTAEILLPGNPTLVDRVLARLTSIPGVRLATPGEFTARAYLNGKLTLDQAEGVAATIAAQNEDQLASARELLSGTAGERYRAWAEEVATLLALVEAGIDFSDQDDVVAIAPAELASRLQILMATIEAHVGSRAGAEARSTLPRVVLAGDPNAGKSTLFNALLRRHRTVVSPIAGTTRDVIEEELDLSQDLPGAGIVLLADMAGLEASVCGIGAIAREHALRAIANADVVLHCDPAGRFPPLRTNAVVIRVCTKADQPGGREAGDVPVCALDGWNLFVLRRAVADAACAGSAQAAAAVLPRHARALSEAASRIRDAEGAGSPELVAGSLRSALDALGEVTGRISPDDVIGRIFSTFCIGK
jgi:tRNA modification GTPase